jgi:hypothetical protein
MRVLKHVELEPTEDGLSLATRLYGETDIQMDRGLRESIRVSGNERRPYRTDETRALRAVFIYLLKDRRMDDDIDSDFLWPGRFLDTANTVSSSGGSHTSFHRGCVSGLSRSR